MMMNSSRVSYIALVAFFDTGILRPLYFLIIMFLYSLIVCSNVFLIMVIYMNRSLHEPMYLFLCSLLANQLWGSTGLFPSLLVQIISEIHTVSVLFCFLQIYCVHFYGSVEFFTLGVMSYDRYLAICCPLHYNTRMTHRKVAGLTAFVWLYSVFATVAMLSLSAPLQLCGNIINKVYCDNFSIVKLACSDTTINNIYGLVYIFSVIVPLIILIIITYMRILRVCFSGCKQSRQKAISTCTPHIASLLNFSCGCLFEIVQSRFNMSRLPNMLRIFLSLYFLTCQPLLNPVVYGLRMSKINAICKNLLYRKHM